MASDDEAPVGASEKAQKQQEERQTFRGSHVVAAPLSVAPMLQRPSISSDGAHENGVAHRLAAAAELARQGSLAQLAVWFPGYDFAAAAQTSDDRRFQILSIGDALHTHLGALEVVETLLATHSLGNQIRFSHGERSGQEPPRVFDTTRPRLRRPRVGPLTGSLDQQWTTVLNNIDTLDPVIAGVCEHLERAYASRVNTNAYLSFGQAEGFGPHWDGHDTIIVPALGTKKWTVFEPTTLSPLRPWVGAAVSERPVWEGEIEPGMCLVIPRGWGHKVDGSDDLSLHYTIGINRPTISNILERIPAEGAYAPLVRADSVYEPTDPVASYETSLLDTPASLGEYLSDLVTTEFVDRALSTYRARIPLRIFPRLYDMWTATGIGDWRGALLRMPVPAGVQLMGTTPASALIAFDNQRIEVTPAAFEIVLALADTREHKFEDLPTESDPEIRSIVCKELARAGLVDVRYAS